MTRIQILSFNVNPFDFNVKAILKYNDIPIEIERVIISDYENDYFYDYLKVNINKFTLVKDWYFKGFQPKWISKITKGSKKKALSQLRKELKMSKQEFSKLMGKLGKLWFLPKQPHLIYQLFK